MSLRILFALLFALGNLSAQEAAPQVFRDRVAPRWFDGGKKFWYENRLPGDKREIVAVDAETGTREVVDKAPDAASGEREGLRAETETRPSLQNGSETVLVFENRLSQAVEIFWLDARGERRTYGQIPAGGKRELETYAGHVWLVTNSAGESLAVFEAVEGRATAVIDGTLPKWQAAPQRRRRGADRPPADGRAVVKEFNVFAGDVQITSDGTEERPYSSVFYWAPDGKKFVGFRTEPASRKEVHLVESSPKEGGRAILRSRPYSLPGDKFSRYEVFLFDLDAKRGTKMDVDAFESERDMPRIRWSKDGSRFAWTQVDRGHQRLRVIDVEAASGKVRNLIDEKTDTFIWTAHAEMNPVRWLEKSDAFLYASEASGWRHLYFVDAISGRTNAVTKGEWVMRGIESVDEEKGEVWFRASGVFAGQDPYLIHFGRAKFDGSETVWLTESDGNHAVQFSPDRRFIIDTYSRVDAAPVSELRKASDGKLVCKLEEAEVTGWSKPEVFVAKGRDGKTDIWGVIFAPPDLEAGKKHPVLEDIYAGPHGSFVPKSFSAARRYREWRKLGFAVVKIDGMGTANRSKAFHDVAWKNLRDAGFPDRILWMKAAAKKFPWLDLSRVGIYGTSAGGQSAAAAVIWHADFYKAAVANCGCHDNRMDKASWNEQWMGYPVGPHYAENSNVDNAGKLGGALFLVVGEMDTNVPPESTLRVADALIKADKDFELLVVPGAEHGTRGPAGPYVDRRMRDFFSRHLKP